MSSLLLQSESSSLEARYIVGIHIMYNSVQSTISEMMNDTQCAVGKVSYHEQSVVSSRCAHRLTRKSDQEAVDWGVGTGICQNDRSRSVYKTPPHTSHHGNLKRPFPITMLGGTEITSNYPTVLPKATHIVLLPLYLSR